MVRDRLKIDTAEFLKSDGAWWIFIVFVLLGCLIIVLAAVGIF